MLLLGLDIGTSSVKVSVVDAHSGLALCAAQYPEQEAAIHVVQPGWAEQSPDTWWEHTKLAIKKLHSFHKYDPAHIQAIGIAYQMHGLVVTNKQGDALRESIIWCDSRAVPYGEKAFRKLGADYCLGSLLNSPGNFTAAKLAWVKENEPRIFEQIHLMMLPGDFISLKMTGRSTTSIAALSEGIFWDFKAKEISKPLLDHFGFDNSIFPEIKNVFAEHGRLTKLVANELNLQEDIPVSYKAGDQPNNAFSLSVLQPGEVAANAGTSGVIYAVSDNTITDPLSRINNFAHVNHQPDIDRIGVLLCINGAGISNRWIRSLADNRYSYDELNQMAAGISAGSEGLVFLPFGNGAERMLENKYTGAEFRGIDLNKHNIAHLYRAGLEGVAFAFRYGIDIMKQCGVIPSVIKAGYANMFLSDLFTSCFVNATGVPVELYKNDGSCGAALGAGVGAGLISFDQAFSALKPVRRTDPDRTSVYNELYSKWAEQLKLSLPS